LVARGKFGEDRMSADVRVVTESPDGTTSTVVYRDTVPIVARAPERLATKISFTASAVFFHNFTSDRCAEIYITSDASPNGSRPTVIVEGPPPFYAWPRLTCRPSRLEHQESSDDYELRISTIQLGDPR